MKLLVADATGDIVVLIYRVWRTLAGIETLKFLVNTARCMFPDFQAYDNGAWIDSIAWAPGQCSEVTIDSDENCCHLNFGAQFQRHMALHFQVQCCKYKSWHQLVERKLKGHVPKEEVLVQWEIQARRHRHKSFKAAVPNLSVI